MAQHRNGLRLAGALSKREDEAVKVFLIGDAASCAKELTYWVQ